ncbi:membrane hypothetical protein [Microcystis aeruginosa PCC 9807]|uniref:VCBS repeat-containing protein n=1 Tax=Microcystis aeruginosa PCC 9807 TaxID=1160283 RepID=I4H9G1_MICAE|nr:hypothetical protein [Microcystis aeruginosa]CCI18685.1 membrane hypothetical protein [Microcystis aeruginosa PCC 9807]
MEEERNRRSDTKTDDNFESPSWLKSFSASLSKLSKKLQITFDRLLFVFDEEQKQKIKRVLYYLICFVGFFGYAIFEILILVIWIVFRLIVSKTDQKARIGGKGHYNLFSMWLELAVFLNLFKKLLVFLLRCFGGERFNYSEKGLGKFITNLVREIRPSPMTFRCGVLTIIIVAYFSIQNAIAYIQVNSLDFASGVRPPAAYEKIKNAEYTIVDENSVPQTYKLIDGKYEYRVNENWMGFVGIGKIAFGDINGDGKDDAVVELNQNNGGILVRPYLTAILDYNNAFQQTNQIGIDNIEKMYIYDGKITANMLTHAKTDPRCCPSLQVKKVYQYNGQGLEEYATNSNPSINQLPLDTN